MFPDVVAYHEYGDPADALSYLDDLRRFLRENKLTRPISVNEIFGQEFWTIPGYIAGVLATYERAGISVLCMPAGRISMTQVATAMRTPARIPPWTAYFSSIVKTNDLDGTSIKPTPT